MWKNPRCLCHVQIPGEQVLIKVFIEVRGSKEIQGNNQSQKQAAVRRSDRQGIQQE